MYVYMSIYVRIYEYMYAYMSIYVCDEVPESWWWKTIVLWECLERKYISQGRHKIA